MHGRASLSRNNKLHLRANIALLFYCLTLKSNNTTKMRTFCRDKGPCVSLWCSVLVRGACSQTSPTCRGLIRCRLTLFSPPIKHVISSLPVFQVDFQYLPIAFEELLDVLFSGSVAQPPDVYSRHGVAACSALCVKSSPSPSHGRSHRQEAVESEY